MAEFPHDYDAGDVCRVCNFWRPDAERLGRHECHEAEERAELERLYTKGERFLVHG